MNIAPGKPGTKKAFFPKRPARALADHVIGLVFSTLELANKGLLGPVRTFPCIDNLAAMATVQQDRGRAWAGKIFLRQMDLPISAAQVVEAQSSFN